MVAARSPLVRAAAAASLLAAALVPATKAEAAYPGAPGRIAFSYPIPETTVPEAKEIATVQPDGSGTEIVTDRPGSSIEPSWSPDGRRFAFAAPRQLVGPGVNGIYTAHADGTDVQRVSSRIGFGPSYSPSGGRIIFSTSEALLSIDSDGGQRRTVMRAPRDRNGSRCCLADPVYSPTGDRIAFALGPQSSREAGIWTMRPDRSGLRRLTNPERRVLDGSPDFSPDGREIVFDRTGAGILTMRSDGRGERPVPGQPEGATDPVFSPAGDRIATVSISRAPDGGRCGTLFTITRDGLDPLAVGGNCSGPQGVVVGDPSWQPLPGTG